MRIRIGIGKFELNWNGARHEERRFNAARISRLDDWILGYSRINGQLKQDYALMVQRARDLAMNNEFVTGYLENLERNVLGPEGFRLQCLSSDRRSARELEFLWRDYQDESAGFVSRDGQQGGREFDALILRTLAVDGEAFILRIPDRKSVFGVRYEVLDSLDVDYLYNEDRRDGTRIVMGIEINRDGRPVSYFVRDHENDFYNNGTRRQIPAHSIVHLFHRRFPGQVRGITALAPAVLNINQLDGYKEAEIIAARLQAANCAVYEKIGAADGSNWDEADENGDILREMSPGQIGYAPPGYTLKQVNPNHPNSNFGIFLKSAQRGISNSVGLSYNKATGDYESVNYSSLREASLEDRATYQAMQKFLTSRWKRLQYLEFLKYIENVPADATRARFIGRKFAWVDPQRELAAKKIERELMMTDPLSDIEESGRDPEEVLDRWALWDSLMSERKLTKTGDSEEVKNGELRS